MRGRDLLGDNGIESAQQVELAVVIGRRVAKHRHLNVHTQIKTRITRIGTNFFLSNVKILSG